MLKRYTYFLSLIAVLGLANCARVVDQVPIPDRGPSNLSGTLTLLNEFQHDSLAGDAAANLAITASGNGTEATASYDASSKTYTFANLAPGTYTLRYSADGFGTIVRPGYQHVGGEPRTLAKAFLYRTSTTAITGVGLNNTSTSSSIYYSQQIDLPRDSSYTVKDSVIFTTTNDTGATVRVLVVYPPNSVLRFDKDTSFEAALVFTTVTRQLAYNVVISPVNEFDSARTRGYILYMSDTPDVSPYNYRLSQMGTPLPGNGNVTVTLPLQRFVDAGILRRANNQTGVTANRMLYVAAYGMSGTKNWIGAYTFEGNNRIVIHPGINQTDGSAAKAEIELPELE